MQPLYAITVAVLSLVLPSVLGAPSAKATPARAVPSCLDLPSRVFDRVFDSLPGNFTLVVVISRRNRKSPTPSARPVRIGTYSLASPVLGPVNGQGTGFQLINKIFSITLGPRASILTDIFGTEGVDFPKISTPGLQSVVFDTNTRRPPANFTATAACDNDDKVYLRLRGDYGECFSVCCWKMRGRHDYS